MRYDTKYFFFQLLSYIMFFGENFPSITSEKNTFSLISNWIEGNEALIAKCNSSDISIHRILNSLFFQYWIGWNSSLFVKVLFKVKTFYVFLICISSFVFFQEKFKELGMHMEPFLSNGNDDLWSLCSCLIFCVYKEYRSLSIWCITLFVLWPDLIASIRWIQYYRIKETKRKAKKVFNVSGYLHFCHNITRLDEQPRSKFSRFANKFHLLYCVPSYPKEYIQEIT